MRGMDGAGVLAVAPTVRAKTYRIPCGRRKELTMTPDGKVRIGFVGVGSMGQCAHLKNYVTVDDCEVVAIAEVRDGPGPARSRRATAFPGSIPRTWRCWPARQLDGIVASQPFDRHGILVPEILQAGVPVFTEKPLAALGRGRREDRRRRCAASGTWHMVGYHKRSDPATMYAKAEIDRLKASGELGKMTLRAHPHARGRLDRRRLQRPDPRRRAHARRSRWTRRRRTWTPRPTGNTRPSSTTTSTRST